LQGVTVEAANNIQRAEARQEPPREWHCIGEIYRLKANECLAWAGLTQDREDREEWIRMANVWTQLALRS
jgi:hypothetical protein